MLVGVMRTCLVLVVFLSASALLYFSSETVIYFFLHICDSSQRRLRWISYVDEYGPELHYVEGSANVVADTFLRLSRSDTPTSSTVGKKHRLAAGNNTSEFDDDTPLDNFFSLTEDSEMLECFTCLPSEEYYLNLLDDLVTDNPLDMDNHH